MSQNELTFSNKNVHYRLYIYNIDILTKLGNPTRWCNNASAIYLHMVRLV